MVFIVMEVLFKNGDSKTLLPFTASRCTGFSLFCPTLIRFWGDEIFLSVKKKKYNYIIAALSKDGDVISFGIAEVRSDQVFQHTEYSPGNLYKGS